MLPPFDVDGHGTRRATTAPPTISGAPATTVVVGTPYTFTPTASDPDGQPLTFSIRNRPTWASFDTATGRLQGTPPLPTSARSPTSRSRSATGRWPWRCRRSRIVVTPPPVNRAPVISGAPMTSVEAGTAYTFVPTASDADGNPLTFCDHGPAELGGVRHDARAG